MLRTSPTDPEPSESTQGVGMGGMGLNDLRGFLADDLDQLSTRGQIHFTLHRHWENRETLLATALFEWGIGRTDHSARMTCRVQGFR